VAVDVCREVLKESKAIRNDDASLNPAVSVQRQACGLVKLANFLENIQRFHEKE